MSELPDACLPLSRTFLEGKDEGQERVLQQASLGDGVPGLGYKRGKNGGWLEPWSLQREGLLHGNLS